MSKRDFSRQPWSAYAVQLPTLSPPALLGDLLIVYFCYEATKELGLESDCRTWTLGSLVFWMFTTKFLKLLGHFIRYPSDILLLPVSILFGYAHGVIKVYALFTLNVTAWGSREGADTDDVYRMIRLSQAENER
ncbi:MAG: hypothetical protein M1836_005254 [Candelina mexicana]|nr:MAG: hypothetical protein M1836_005254 [Candelina mexicana]